MSTGAATVLDHVPAGWDALVRADTSSSPSHQPLVWEAFAAVFPGFEWQLLVHREAGVLTAGAPVVLSRRGPLRWLHALPWLLSAAPVAVAGAHARGDVALARSFAELARAQRVIGGEWSCYRSCGDPVTAQALAHVPGNTRWVATALMPLEHGLEPRRVAMGRKARQALDQASDRGLVFAEDADALEEVYALHVMQSRHWPGHRPLPIELSRRLLAARSAGEPVARLFTLRSARGLVSGTLALDGAHETFPWWAGTHSEGRRLQAFTLLLWRVAEWAAAHGRRRVNLGASTGLEGVSAFKKALGAEILEYPVHRLDAGNANAAGRLLASVQAWHRRGRTSGGAEPA